MINKKYSFHRLTAIKLPNKALSLTIITVLILSSFLIFSIPQANATAYQTPTRVSAYSSGSARGTEASTSSISVTALATPTSGNLMIATISLTSGTVPTVSSISETGVTWTQQISKTQGTACQTKIWAGVVGSGASISITITLSGSANSGVADICEYSGLKTSGFLDQTATAGTQWGIASTGTTSTTTQATELCIGAIGVTGGDAVITPTNGFTLLDGVNYQGGGGYNVALGFFENIVSSTGTYESAAAGTNTNNWAGCIVTFYAAEVSAPANIFGYSTVGSTVDSVGGNGILGEAYITPIENVTITGAHVYTGNNAVGSLEYFSITYTNGTAIWSDTAGTTLTVGGWTNDTVPNIRLSMGTYILWFYCNNWGDYRYDSVSGVNRYWASGTIDTPNILGSVSDFKYSAFVDYTTEVLPPLDDSPFTILPSGTNYVVQQHGSTVFTPSDDTIASAWHDCITLSGTYGHGEINFGNGNFTFPYSGVPCVNNTIIKGLSGNLLKMKPNMPDMGADTEYFSISTKNNVTIRDLNIIGGFAPELNATTQTGSVLGTGDHAIFDALFYGLSTQAYNSHYNWINNSVVWSGGVNLVWVNNMTISNNNYQKTGNAFYVDVGSSANIISNNLVNMSYGSSWGFGGIQITSFNRETTDPITSPNIITNNTVINGERLNTNSTFGIFLETNKVQVSNNTILNMGGSGAYYDGTGIFVCNNIGTNYDINITNNYVNGSSGVGIALQSPINNIVSKNIVSNCPTALLIGGTGSTLTYNDFSNCTTKINLIDGTTTSSNNIAVDLTSNVIVNSTINSEVWNSTYGNPTVGLLMGLTAPPSNSPNPTDTPTPTPVPNTELGMYGAVTALVIVGVTGIGALVYKKIKGMHRMVEIYDMSKYAKFLNSLGEQ